MTKKLEKKQANHKLTRYSKENEAMVLACAQLIAADLFPHGQVGSHKLGAISLHFNGETRCLRYHQECNFTINIIFVNQREMMRQAGCPETVGYIVMGTPWADNSHLAELVDFIVFVKWHENIVKTLAHELRHAWQFLTGFPRRLDLPYEQRPHEIDAFEYEQKWS